MQLNVARGFLARLLAPRPDPELTETIARCVDQVEPRLRQAGGYPQRYADAVGRAWSYCRDLAARVPGPVEINRQAFARDPMVHALFSSPEGIVQALVKSRAVREWHQAPEKSRDVFALMGVRRWEKDVFGMEDQGGMLRRDVAQKAVYFSDHTFSNLGDSLPDTHDQLARQFLASLLARVKDRLEALRQNRLELERERDELRARLRSSPEKEAHQARLQQTLSSLSEAVAALDLRAYADHFDAILLHPEQFLGLHPLSMSLDAMGIRQPQETPGPSHALNLWEMTCRDRRHWIVMLVHCRLDELPEYHERLAAEERWLTI